MRIYGWGVNVAVYILFFALKPKFCLTGCLSPISVFIIDLLILYYVYLFILLFFRLILFELNSSYAYGPISLSCVDHSAQCYVVT